jgi:hypothetical protein
MSIKTCRLQVDCPHFITGDNKPRNHHVRVTVPCVKYLDMTCKMPIDISLFYGETIACDFRKIQRIKKELKHPDVSVLPF